MKALTIWPEWSWAFSHLGKRIENRGWEPPQYLGGKQFCLHAGQRVGGVYLVGKDGLPKPKVGKTRHVEFFDCFIKVVNMARLAGFRFNCVGLQDGRLGYEITYGLFRWLFYYDEIPYGKLFAVATLGGGVYQNDSPWFIPGKCGWVLEELKFLKKPVLAKGSRKLWDIKEEAEREVVEQIEQGEYLTFLSRLRC